MKKILLSLLLSLTLAMSAFPTGKDILPPKGFDKKVYDGSFALYASSEQMGIKDRFICTAQAINKVKGGYELLSAGHCTPANVGELPADMTFSVAEDLNESLQPVVLAAAKMQEPVDWAIFYLPTAKKYPVMPLSEALGVSINDKTIDVNFSLALAKEVSLGFVSSKVQSDGDMAGFFQVTQFDSHGASGSSVVSERSHKVLGIVIAGIDGATVPTWVEPAWVIAKEIQDIDVVTARYKLPVAPAPTNDRGIPIK